MSRDSPRFTASSASTSQQVQEPTRRSAWLIGNLRLCSLSESSEVGKHLEGCAWDVEAVRAHWLSRRPGVLICPSPAKVVSASAACTLVFERTPASKRMLSVFSSYILRGGTFPISSVIAPGTTATLDAHMDLDYEFSGVGVEIGAPKARVGVGLSGPSADLMLLPCQVLDVFCGSPLGRSLVHPEPVLWQLSARCFRP